MGSAIIASSSPERDPRCFQLPFTRLRTVKMHVSDDLQTLCSRVHAIVRRRKEKRTMQISAPFNFEKNPVHLPGLSEEQLVMLREKEAASRIGIADPSTPPRAPRSPVSTSSLFSHPVRPPIKSVLTSNSVSSTESLH
ncbi:hypothetical protein CDV36_005742 [Fusarium kuroshium]|uniref:Uncharacterized protein n=1 Tax=Fusarium kuroshium TaxID=2010991 RepID=A0A3M2SAJ1_9HYPO|nr:hypothetical protein CDV36_005742 [Fusarium kuroshium]